MKDGKVHAGNSSDDSETSDTVASGSFFSHVPKTILLHEKEQVAGDENCVLWYQGSNKHKIQASYKKLMAMGVVRLRVPFPSFSSRLPRNAQARRNDRQIFAASLRSILSIKNMIDNGWLVNAPTKSLLQFAMESEIQCGWTVLPYSQLISYSAETPADAAASAWKRLPTCALAPFERCYRLLSTRLQHAGANNRSIYATAGKLPGSPTLSKSSEPTEFLIPGRPAAFTVTWWVMQLCYYTRGFGGWFSLATEESAGVSNRKRNPSVFSLYVNGWPLTFSWILDVILDRTMSCRLRLGFLML